MTAHSDWQELRGLSEEARSNFIYQEAMDLERMSQNFFILGDEKNHLEYITKAQQHLDRIKALVMSRGKE